MELDRRNLLGVLAGLVAAGSSLPAAELQSVLYDPRDVRTEKHPFGALRIYCDGSTSGLKSLVIGSIVLNLGEQPHPPHTHPEEEILLVTEGTGQISLKGNASAAEPGALMYAAPNDLHGIRNTGAAPLTFYFIKWIAAGAPR